VISTRVAALTEGIVKSMFMTKIKAAVLVFVVVGLLGSGLGTLVSLGHGGKPALVAVAAPKQEAKEPAQVQNPATPPTAVKRFQAAPGYKWAVYPSEGRGISWAISQRFPTSGAWVAIEDTDKEGAFVVTLAQNFLHVLVEGKELSSPARPVAFDASRQRYLLTSEHAGSAGTVHLERFRLNPQVLPAVQVKCVGLEVQRPKIDMASATKAVERAKAAGIEVLPLPEEGKVYDFRLTTVEGKKVSGQDWRGKVVVIVCWDASDDISTALMPGIKELYDKSHKDGLEVISISFDGDPNAAAKAYKDMGLVWPQVMVPRDKMTRDLWRAATGSAVVPRAILLDRDGIARADEFGGQFAQELDNLGIAGK
jgi:peroxiredoxin